MEMTVHVQACTSMYVDLYVHTYVLASVTQ